MAINSAPHGAAYEIRTYRPGDRPAVLALFTGGMLTGHIDGLEGSDDVENIDRYYLGTSGCHFWVAQDHSGVIGMIGVVQDDRRVAHIRRLRVEPLWQQTSVAYQLVKTTVAHASDNGALKIVLHTPVDPDRATHLLTHLGFIYARSKMLHGRRLLEFYLNLYQRIPPEQEESETLWRLT